MTILYFQPNDCPAGQITFSGAAARAQERGVILQTVGAANKVARIRALLDFWHPDACIVESGDDTRYPPSSVFGRIPTVFIERDPRTLPKSARVVNIDAAAVTGAAARELLGLGLRNIAYVPVSKPTRWAKERTSTFLAALKLNGIRCHVCRHTPDDPDDARGLTDWLARLPRPCGIFAATDILGRLVLSAIRLIGATVPDDFAVIGVDNDTNICENTSPTLSSVASDYALCGRLAVDSVCDDIRGVRCFGVREVVRRASTFIPSARYPGVAKALDLIRTKACRGLRARDVAAATGFSRRLAETRFRAATGSSILEAIRDVRFNEALRLLASGSAPLEQIPLLCGWNGSATFRRYFKARTGLTMREWRDKEGGRREGGRVRDR